MTTSADLPVVELRGLCLDYPMRPSSHSFKEVLFRAISGAPNHEIVSYPALRGVDLCVRRGERVALLGRNGAGKSTLLRCVAGIYPASGGEVEVRGQARALLELSLGFEPDATGRENIMYRGLLCGKTPREMRALEPAIVAFAELGEFIDCPLRTYSAGMQVRLAFSITTSFDADVLLIDEVLGAGDAHFAAKARGRMIEVLGSSRAALFATHDLDAVRALGTRAIVLDRGRIAFDGPADAAIGSYLRQIGLAS